LPFASQDGAVGWCAMIGACDGQHLRVMPTNDEVAGQFFLGADMSTTTWNRDNRDDAA
jgi:hypothetical protein